MPPCTERPWECVTSQNSRFPSTSIHLRGSTPGTFHSLGWTERLCVSLSSKENLCDAITPRRLLQKGLTDYSGIFPKLSPLQGTHRSILSTLSIIVEIGNDWEERKEGKGKRLCNYIAEFIHLFFLLQSEVLQSSSPEFPLEMFWLYNCGLYLFLISLPEVHQKTIQFRNSLDF